VSDALKGLLFVVAGCALTAMFFALGRAEKAQEDKRCAPVAEAFSRALVSNNPELAAQWATIAAQVSCSRYLKGSSYQ
jgi:hypothetical protein